MVPPPTSGGGVDRARVRPLLIRKSMLRSSFSLSGSYYVDAVSNASIDVVTTASKYHEETQRPRADIGLDYVYARFADPRLHVGGSTSREPDYTRQRAGNVDLTQDVFGGMTTVVLGFTHANDKVGSSTARRSWIDTACRPLAVPAGRQRRS